MAILNRDATTPTPNESPLTVSTVVLELVPHPHAKTLHLRPVGADVRYGDNGTLDGTANEGYAVVADGGSIDIPVTPGGSVYVLRDAAVNVALGFHFEVFT